jgi:thiamine transport system permease protein
MRPFGPALPALALVAALVGGAAVGLAPHLGEGTGGDLFDGYILAILRFTVLQAVLSAVLSIGLAIPVARALARRDFPGRGLMLRLFGLPMIVPSLAGAFGMLAIFGRGGWLADLAAAFGSDWRPDIYGLGGIVLAHAFFNLPFSVRVLTNGWSAIPAERWRLAAMLGLGPAAVFRLVEAPMLRRQVPPLFVMVLLLCITSFAVVVTLGGGPAAATLEVAIYQAVRFDAALGRAAALGLVQVVLCLVLAALAGAAGRDPIGEAGIGRAVRRWERSSPALDALLIAAAALFVLLPLAAIVSDGLAAVGRPIVTDATLWGAFGRSLAIALAAGVLSLVLGWGLATSMVRLRGRGRPRAAGALDLVGTIVFVTPPLVIGAGLFLLLRGTALDPFRLGAWSVIPINALMALPFATRLLIPALADSAERHDRLCASLGIRGLDRLRLVDGPAARRPAALALALAVCLAFGDFGVIALFGSSGTETLPLLLAQLLGGYRLAEASFVVLLLLATGLLLFVAIERGLAGRQQT